MLKKFDTVSIDRLSSCYLAVFHLQFIKINSYRYFGYNEPTEKREEKNTSSASDATNCVKSNQEENSISFAFSVGMSRFGVRRETKKRNQLEHEVRCVCVIIAYAWIVKARNQNECNKATKRTKEHTTSRKQARKQKELKSTMKSYFIIPVTDIVILFAIACASVAKPY